jgi:enoyl-CoA hydratase
MRNLLYEKHGNIGIIKINRPDQLNALNSSTLTEINDFMDRAAIQEELKAVIFTGAGDRAFIAGADVKEISILDAEGFLKFSTLGDKVTRGLETAPLITISAINGYALGGGVEFALACDLIFAAKNAKLGFPDVSLGLIPGFGGTQRLARIVGARKAKEIIMTARLVSAEEAQELHIINKVFDDETLMEQTIDFTERMLRNSFHALMHAKVAIEQGLDQPIQRAMEVERIHFMRCFAHQDARERIAKFLNRPSSKNNLQSTLQ